MSGLLRFSLMRIERMLLYMKINDLKRLCYILFQLEHPFNEQLKTLQAISGLSEGSLKAQEFFGSFPLYILKE